MRKFRDISIRHKIMAVIILTSAIVMILSVLVFIIIEILSFKNKMVQSLSVLADVIGTNSAAALLFDDTKAAEEVLSALKAEANIIEAHIFKKDDKIFACYAKTNGNCNIIKKETYDLEKRDYIIKNNRLVLSRNIIIDNEKVGTVYLHSDLNALYSSLKNYGMLAAAILISSFIIAYLLALRFQRVISNPILTLADAMQSVSNEKTYTIRAEKISNDELGTLINGFNIMIEQIQIQDEKLREHRDKLEEQVALRTFELLDTNKDLKEAMQKLMDAKNNAEAANRAKSDFLANMSHELRTPLNHIIGFTQLVIDKHFGELNETQEEYLGDVLNSSKHLLALINDILDLSKVEAGKMELCPSELSIKKLLEESLVMVKEKAIKHGINFMKQIEDVPDKIWADERKLKQIMYNLLSNAVKFTPDGGTLTLKAVVLSSEQEGYKAPELKISITDTGIGLKKEDLERIFNSFEQVESSKSRRFQGTGLGLSLTEKLIKLHGGKIWAESEGIGKGSTFHFVIPI